MMHQHTPAAAATAAPNPAAELIRHLEPHNGLTQSEVWDRQIMRHAALCRTEPARYAFAVAVRVEVERVWSCLFPALGFGWYSEAGGTEELFPEMPDTVRTTLYDLTDSVIAFCASSLGWAAGDPDEDAFDAGGMAAALERQCAILGYAAAHPDLPPALSEALASLPESTAGLGATFEHFEHDRAVLLDFPLRLVRSSGEGIRESVARLAGYVAAARLAPWNL